MEEWDDEFDDDMEEKAYRDCPKCGRTYDDIDFDFQICGKCGWDAINEQYDEPREPNQQDFDNGEADILTGRWI